MSTTQGKKRGRPPTKPREQAAPPPLAPKPNDEKKQVYRAIKKLLGKLEGAQIPDDETGGSNALELFLARLAAKSPSALDYHLLSQSLVPWWSDFEVQDIAIVSGDLTPSVVEALVDLFRQALRKGKPGVVDEGDELELEDLKAMEEWVGKIWEAVGMLAVPPPSESADPPSHLASPEVEVSVKDVKPAPRPKMNKNTTKEVSRKSAPPPRQPAVVTNTSSPEFIPPTPAHSTESKKPPTLKRKPSVPTVEVPLKTKGGGGKAEMRVKARMESVSVEVEMEESGSSSRRRSGRQPSHVPSASQAASSKRRYPVYSVLMVQLDDDLHWPAAIVEEPEKGYKIHGEYHEDDYLVQLLPTRKHLWISHDDTSPLPSKYKRHVPLGLKKKDAVNYEHAVDLLNNDLMLDRWLNAADDSQDSEYGGMSAGGQSEAEVPVRSAKKARRS